jgi:hypothetical protein
MYKPFESPGSFFAIILCVIFLVLSGCENPGSVGSGLSKSKADVETDTIFVKGVQAIQPNSYSGELSFFSTGHYDDPLFGSMEATAFLKPRLPGDDNTMDEDAKMLMRIILDGDQVYGDRSAAQEFSIYEIDELWRDRALKIYDDIEVDTTEKVGEFTIEEEDSLDVELSAEWVEKYRQFTGSTNADSLYKYNLFGLAVVPDNKNKIIPLNSSSTRFVIQNPEADTFDVSTKEWGYNLERSVNNTMPQGSVPLYSTYENVINFDDLGISELDIFASGFSKAELVLYQNNAEMEQSMQSEPTTVRRANELTVDLHLADSAAVPENIDPGIPLSEPNARFFRIRGSYSASKGSYRFDITNLAERIIQVGVPENREYFITFPNDGVIKPGLIYTDSDQVPVDKQPKIIITSLKNSSN